MKSLLYTPALNLAAGQPLINAPPPTVQPLPPGT